MNELMNDSYLEVLVPFSGIPKYTALFNGNSTVLQAAQCIFHI